MDNENILTKESTDSMIKTPLQKVIWGQIQYFRKTLDEITKKNEFNEPSFNLLCHKVAIEAYYILVSCFQLISNLRYTKENFENKTYENIMPPQHLRAIAGLVRIIYEQVMLLRYIEKGCRISDGADSDIVADSLYDHNLVRSMYELEKLRLVKTPFNDKTAKVDENYKIMLERFQDTKCNIEKEIAKRSIEVQEHLNNGKPKNLFPFLKSKFGDNNRSNEVSWLSENSIDFLKNLNIELKKIWTQQDEIELEYPENYDSDIYEEIMTGSVLYDVCSETLHAETKFLIPSKEFGIFAKSILDLWVPISIYLPKLINEIIDCLNKSYCLNDESVLESFRNTVDEDVTPYATFIQVGLVELIINKYTRKKEDT